MKIIVYFLFKLIFLLCLGILASSPGFAEDLADALVNLFQEAKQSFQKNELSKSLEILDQLISVNPDASYAYMLRLTIHEQLHQTIKTIDDCQQLMRLKPFDDYCYGNLGWFYLEKENLLRQKH